MQWEESAAICEAKFLNDTLRLVVAGGVGLAGLGPWWKASDAT